jgi:hypothetical protein
MKVELKNIKYAAFASQETNCFEATLYVNGKRRGTVRNDGHGGCNYYTDHEAERELDEYAKTLPKESFTFEGVTLDLQKDGDSIVDDILTDHLTRKHLQKKMRSKVMFVQEQKLWETSTFSKQDMPRAIKHYTEKGFPVLNIMPLDHAIEIYRRTAA